MEPNRSDAPVVHAVVRLLRASVMVWMFTAILPLPILAASDPADSAIVSCVYLGIACGWLAAHFASVGSERDSRLMFLAKTGATCIAVATNVAVFISIGVAVRVKTNLPFAAMATLSAGPAIGIVPWMLRRVRQSYAALILTGMLVLGVKLSACVVARFVYGPDFIARGYVAADWQTAKLMIWLFWTGTILLSLGMLVWDWKRPAPAVHSHQQHLR